MAQHPIKTLLREHAEIMAEVGHMRLAVQQLADQGDAAVAEALPVFAAVAQMMATQLELHRQKEDQVFFPAIEAVIGQFGPTSVMRIEHQQIHAQGVLLRETLYELNQVQHPAIEAGAAKLRGLVAAGGSAVALRRAGEEIIDLLNSHFGKEEHILFPMAQSLLDGVALSEIAARFEEMDAAGV
ncbi:MAG: hemerythrin domain-containing protein [Caldilineales bacterium]|nr:hemerythrin domain-containing protein [Caldilineales bacterium]